MRALRKQDGSALVEAAIVFPCLILIVSWSATLTDRLIAKQQASQAVRLALWDTTVFRRQPDRQVQVDTTSERVSIGGQPKLPDGLALPQAVLGLVGRTLAKSIDAEVEREGFDVHGKAVARAPLAPLASEHPMQLVFDTWKAWPKPPQHDVSPMRTYPVVEEQVSAQVKRIAFFGLAGQRWFERLRSAGATVAAALGPMAGGALPDVFSADRTDGPSRGPLTILPPEPADVAWAPAQCDVRGRAEPCATQRLGDLRSSRATPAFLDDTVSLGPGVDRTRYTLPYRINTPYWSKSGGTNAGDSTGTEAKLIAAPARLTTANEFVNTYRCRGHFFAGSQRAQEGDPSRRYPRSCSR